MGSAVKRFTKNCKEFLIKQGLNDLRAYGRGIGVDKPTTLKKQELIENIIGVLSGAIIPIEISKRGAPVKNDSVKPEFLVGIERIKIAYLNELNAENGATLASIGTSTKDFVIKGTKKDDPTKLVVEDDTQEVEELSTPIYKGQLINLNGVMQLVPLDFQADEEILILPNRFLKEYDLRAGDVVSCRAKKKENVLVATAVLTVNDLVIHSFTRGDFNKSEVAYPSKTISFIKEGRKNSVFSKYMHWLAPICKGQRACLVAPPKSGKTTLLFEMLKSVKSCNPEIEVMALLVDQSPETVSKFRTSIAKDSFIYTTYEDEPERQVFAGDFILERAKRYAECGKDVVLFIDSLNTLARAFNETDASSGGKTLAGGLERKTVHYLKKYFGSSRCFAESGSLTIIATLSSATGNPADEIITAETSNIANAEIVLDLQMAMKRVYPALSPIRTHVSMESNAEFENLDKTFRQVFLSKHKEEELIEVLSKTETYEELLSVLCR